jgi:hypothetical protein
MFEVFVLKCCRWSRVRALVCAWCGVSGCPQDIARRGYYGAFLLEDWPTLKDLVSTLYNHLDVPGTLRHIVYLPPHIAAFRQIIPLCQCMYSLSRFLETTRLFTLSDLQNADSPKWGE